MGSLGSEPIVLMCVCVVCLVMKLKYELLDLLVKMWRIHAMANMRRRNKAGVDEIAQAINWMVDAMQPVAAQPKAIVPPAIPVTMEDVLKHKPSKFNGKATPDEADAWLRKCEKIFRVLACTKAQQLSFATFLLVGDAEYWWTGMQQMQTRQEEVSWTNFRTRFLEKYFPDSAKHVLEAEFLTFQHGNQPVQTYIDRFKYLARFYSQAITEEWRCHKFEGGLRHELRRVLVPLGIREFPVLVEQARTVEKLEIGPSRVARAQKNTLKARQ